MGQESDLTVKGDIDLSDYIRIVSEEGNSRRSTILVLKSLIESGTATPFFNVVGSGDDKGLIVTEQFSVGTPCGPKEAAFGSGDSYPVGTECVSPDDTPEAGSAWHCSLSNTIEQTITSATDITNTLASDTGSTIGFFNETTTGNYLLIGSVHKFAGLKVKINTAGVIEADNIQGEFLSEDGVDWTPTNLMVTQADYPYEQRANIPASIGGESEQWHFGFNPLVDRNTWQQSTLNINGEDYTKYWGRIRITSDITTDAIVEQVKLHTDRTEINADGTVEKYGLAVYPRTLIFGVDKLINNSARSPSNQNVTYDAGVVIANYTDNQFNNGTIDSGLLIQNIVSGIHTGVPLILSISFYVEGTTIGNVEWEADVYEIKDEFVYDGTAIPKTYSNIAQITTPSNLVRKTTNILIDISHLTYNDAILINIKRDATSGNPDDTLADDCVITNVRLTGYFWKP